MSARYLECAIDEIGIVVLFGLTSFLAAALLFSVQPMIGKMVLPVFGGTPAVWNTCLVYFQVMLLGGYLFAHWNASHRGGRAPDGRRSSTCSCWRCCWRWAIVLQPIAIEPGVLSELGRARTRRSSCSAFWRSRPLCRLLMVSATAPLLQRWFALTPHPRAHDPYFLYAASNAGSLLALLAYPLLIEPTLGLTMQSRLWRAGFLVLAILVLDLRRVARRLSRSSVIQKASTTLVRRESRLEHAGGKRISG